MGRKMKFFTLISIALACTHDGTKPSKAPSCSSAKLYCPDGSTRSFSRSRVSYKTGVWPFQKTAYRCKMRSSMSNVMKNMKDNCPNSSKCSEIAWNRLMIRNPVCIYDQERFPLRLVLTEIGQDLFDLFDFDVGCVSHRRCYYLPHRTKEECDKEQQYTHRNMCNNKYDQKTQANKDCLWAA